MNCDRKIGDPFKWQNSFPGFVPRTSKNNSKCLTGQNEEYAY